MPCTLVYICTFIYLCILHVDIMTITYRRSRRSLYTFLSLGASTTLKYRIQTLVSTAICDFGVTTLKIIWRWNERWSTYRCTFSTLDSSGALWKNRQAHRQWEDDSSKTFSAICTCPWMWESIRPSVIRTHPHPTQLVMEIRRYVHAQMTLWWK